MTERTALDLADQARAETAALLDRQLSPLGQSAMDTLGLVSGDTVLDIGCGAGETLVQLTRRVGQNGRIIGVDIAPRVVALARSRTTDLSQVEIIQADAATLDLPDGLADAVYSRFGVMAIADPRAAFSNFRRMAKPGGRLAFVCWRSLAENDLDRIPLEAAGFQEPIDASPFTFARRDDVEEMLLSAGWRNIAIEAVDRNVSSGDLDAMTAVLTKVGPLGKILRENPALLPRAETKLRLALASYDDAGGINLKAAVWVVTAIA